MKFRATFIVLCLIACVIFISSCSSLGPVYQKADPPAKKAVIYIYRQTRYVGISIRYSVWDITNSIVKHKASIVYDKGKEHARVDNFWGALEDGKKLAVMLNGSYYAYTVNPGTYYFIVESFTGGSALPMGATDFIAKVDAKVGGRYFLFTTVGPFSSGRPIIEPRTVTQGEQEIADCNLVPVVKE